MGWLIQKWQTRLYSSSDAVLMGVSFLKVRAKVVPLFQCALKYLQSNAWMDPVLTIRSIVLTIVAQQDLPTVQMEHVFRMAFNVYKWWLAFPHRLQLQSFLLNVLTEHARNSNMNAKLAYHALMGSIVLMVLAFLTFCLVKFLQLVRLVELNAQMVIVVIHMMIAHRSQVCRLNFYVLKVSYYATKRL